MIKEIQDCFRTERLYYTGHAKDEMETEELGEILEEEVSEAVLEGNIIEAYQPHPEQWIDFTRRRQ